MQWLFNNRVTFLLLLYALSVWNIVVIVKFFINNYVRENFLIHPKLRYMLFCSMLLSLALSILTIILFSTPIIRITFTYRMLYFLISYLYVYMLMMFINHNIVGNAKTIKLVKLAYGFLFFIPIIMLPLLQDPQVVQYIDPTLYEIEVSFKLLLDFGSDVNDFIYKVFSMFSLFGLVEFLYCSFTSFKFLHKMYFTFFVLIFLKSSVMTLLRLSMAVPGAPTLVVYQGLDYALTVLLLSFINYSCCRNPNKASTVVAYKEGVRDE